MGPELVRRGALVLLALLSAIASSSFAQEKDLGSYSVDERTERNSSTDLNRKPANRAGEEEEGVAGASFDEPPLVSTLAGAWTNQVHASSRDGAKLRIVRLFAPEAIQNGTQNVTLDCMFNYDRKLDQRITIKWFFNDELEPVYQWIPELNKRVYSDRYERFLDKSYQVNEDADFMLQAYRKLLADEPLQPSGALPAARSIQEGGETSARTLARRLQRLAKLGGPHSRQLLEALRSALNMQQAELSRFRALRLIRPTSELSGRFTCSVSSLDGDDLRSTALIVYEPAKEFAFSATRLESANAPSSLYNLTCSAGRLFPRPSLSLLRYRAGPLGLEQRNPALTRLRPRLAATLLRPEPLEGAHTQLSLVVPVRAADNELQEPHQTTLGYDILVWALVDEASLSSNLVSQFECQLAIEGTGYERRQSLTLQRGWNTNSAALVSRSTLLGLFSALASVLCLVLAVGTPEIVSTKPPTIPSKPDEPDREAAGRPTGSKLSIATLTSKLAAETSAEPESAQAQNRRPPVDSDGVYRIPGGLQRMEPNGHDDLQIRSTFGTRYAIGGSQQFYNAVSAANRPRLARQPSQATSIAGQGVMVAPAMQPELGTPLYC